MSDSSIQSPRSIASDADWRRFFGCTRSLRVRLRRSDDSLNDPPLKISRISASLNYDSDPRPNSPQKIRPAHRKYRRRNCRSCLGCTLHDCRVCHSCREREERGHARKLRCVKRKCLEPLLPRHAACNECGRRRCRVPVRAPTQRQKLKLMECGFCCEVVHPVCQILALDLDFDVSCKFYKIPNAWDCLRCALAAAGPAVATSPGKAVDAGKNAESSRISSKTTPPSIRPSENNNNNNNNNKNHNQNQNKEDDHHYHHHNHHNHHHHHRPPPPSSPKRKRGRPPRISPSLSSMSSSSFPNLPSSLPSSSSSSSSPRCSLCGETGTDLMTCHRCARLDHEVCVYSRQRGGRVTLPGIRDCLDPRFWECPSCLAARGLTRKTWLRRGVFADREGEDESERERIVTKRELTMFSAQTGTVSVVHVGVAFKKPRVEEPEVVNCSIRGDDPEVAAAMAAASILSATPSTSACPLCRAAFPDAAAVNAHVRALHPKCGHCATEEFFLDIPKVLSHLKRDHAELSKCKVTIADETLTLVMNVKIFA